MADGTTTWSVRINDGLEQVFTTLTGSYRDAAVAAIAMLPFERTDAPNVVEIWVPELMADYPPMIYRMDEDEFGRRVVTHLIRLRPRAA